MVAKVSTKFPDQKIEFLKTGVTQKGFGIGPQSIHVDPSFLRHQHRFDIGNIFWPIENLFEDDEVFRGMDLDLAPFKLPQRAPCKYLVMERVPGRKQFGPYAATTQDCQIRL